MHVRVHARQVVCEQHCVSTAVENFGDRLEALLAGCVPNLELEGQVLHAHQQGAEFDAHGHLVVLCKLVVAHAVHQARLANPRVPNHDQLEEEVLLQGVEPTALHRYYLVSQLLDRRFLDLLNFLGFFRSKHSITRADFFLRRHYD